MGKQRRLNANEIASLRRAKRDGYLTYRYGSATPITLARIFSGQPKQAMVGKTLDLMRPWRTSPFEHEGPTRAGIRAGLCSKGHGWERSDNEAAALIEESLRILGATRPTWPQGQPEYVIGRENCAQCRGPLDEETIARRDRFCSDECRTIMRAQRNENYWYAAAEASKWAYAIARKEGIPERACEWCGDRFKPATPDAVTCSPEHAAKVREQRAGRVIPVRECRNPSCGKLFQPAKRTVEYCSQACHREHQATLLEPKPCENPDCGIMFQPRTSTAKFCGGKCRTAVLKGRTLPAKPCAHCGEAFAPKKAANMFCSKSCASRSRAAKTRETAFTCEECPPAPYLDAAE